MFTNCNRNGISSIFHRFFLEWLCCLLCAAAFLSTIVPVESRTERAELEIEVEGWEKHVSRDAKKYIDPIKDTTTISGQEICNDSNTKIVIIVPSAPNESNYRTAIRESWANHTLRHTKVGFFLGLAGNETLQEAIENESDEHKDIIQDSFIDCYSNLTLKSISILKWFLRSCNMSYFLVKADSDTFIDVRMLAYHLADYPRGDVLGGDVCWPCEVVRKKPNKLWRVYSSRYMFAGDVYPRYLLGYAYYMSRDAAAKLYGTALETPVFHNEDVFITGICAEKAKVARINDSSFHSISKGGFFEYRYFDYCTLDFIHVCSPVQSEYFKRIIHIRNYYNFPDTDVHFLYETAMSTSAVNSTITRTLQSVTVPPRNRHRKHGKPKLLQEASVEVSASPSPVLNQVYLQCTTLFVAQPFIKFRLQG